MNRRDMIIVAVLMNTGLLAVLFMMAMQTDDGGVSTGRVEVQESITKVTPSQAEVIALSEPVKSVVLPHSSSHDELDNAINAYAAGASTAPVLIHEEVLLDIPKILTPSAAISRPVVKNDPEYVEISVKRGDSLDKIARGNGVSISALRNANNLSTDRLQIGQVLRVPVGSVSEVAVKKSKVEITPQDVGTEYYTLKSGDNPWKIAKKFHVRFDQLLKLNNLDESKARRMKAGDKIRVR